MEAILWIPLSRRHVLDIVMWMLNINGVYSMKSSYHLARMISREVGDRRKVQEERHKNQI